MRLKRFGFAVAVLVGLMAIAPQAWAAQVTITSPSSATFTAGVGGTFTVTTGNFTSGKPPAITVTGMPTGVTFTDKSDGTGTLTVASTAVAQTSILSIDAAANAGAPNDTDANTQSFTLEIDPPSTATPAPVSTATCRTLDANQAPRSQFLRGDRFFVRGLLPGSNGNVSVLFNGVTDVGSGRQNEDGSYLVPAQVPSNAGLGANTVVVKKLTVTATCGINVVLATAGATATPRSPTTLPTTGSPILPIGIAGLLFLGTGTAMLAYYRRQAWALVSAVWTEADVFSVREKH